MLTRLSQQLDIWKPAKAVLAPLDVVRAAWVNVVGTEVAQHSLPAEIHGETLTIFTRSGTWNQQLGFLEETLLKKLSELALPVSITSLRFRVGKITQQLQRQKRRAKSVQQVLRLQSPARANESLEDLLLRLRARAQVLREKRGARCSRCQVALPPRGRICAPCAHALSQERLYRIMRLLREAPWLSDEELQQSGNRLQAEEIATARATLLSRWRRELDVLERKCTFRRGEPERATAVAYVMLATGLPPDRLTRAITRYTLGPRLDALLYGETALASE